MVAWGSLASVTERVNQASFAWFLAASHVRGAPYSGLTRLGDLNALPLGLELYQTQLGPEMRSAWVRQLWHPGRYAVAEIRPGPKVRVD